MGSKWNVIKNILKKGNLIRWNLYFDDKINKRPLIFIFLKKSQDFLTVLSSELIPVYLDHKMILI